MQSRIFWLAVVLLSVIADMTLPFVWGLVATIPIVFASWWLVYRSGWF